MVPQSMAATAPSRSISPCYHGGPSGRTTAWSAPGDRSRQVGWRPICWAVHSPMGSSAPVSHQARWAWRHLTPATGAPHPPARPRTTVVGIDEGVPFLGIAGVGRLDPIHGHGLLGLSDATGRLQSTDLFPQRGVDQPESGGHGRAVVEERGVGDHRRSALVGTDDHLEAPGRATTEQLGHRSQIGRNCPRSRRAVHRRPVVVRPVRPGPGPDGHRQNSRVSATRPQYEDGAVGCRRPVRHVGRRGPARPRSRGVRRTGRDRSRQHLLRREIRCVVGRHQRLGAGVTAGRSQGRRVVFLLEGRTT